MQLNIATLQEKQMTGVTSAYMNMTIMKKRMSAICKAQIHMVPLVHTGYYSKACNSTQYGKIMKNYQPIYGMVYGKN